MRYSGPLLALFFSLAAAAPVTARPIEPAAENPAIRWCPNVEYCNGCWSQHAEGEKEDCGEHPPLQPHPNDVSRPYLEAAWAKGAVVKVYLDPRQWQVVTRKLPDGTTEQKLGETTKKQEYPGDVQKEIGYALKTWNDHNGCDCSNSGVVFELQEKAWDRNTTPPDPFLIIGVAKGLPPIAHTLNREPNDQAVGHQNRATIFLRAEVFENPRTRRENTRKAILHEIGHTFALCDTDRFRDAANTLMYYAGADARDLPRTPQRADCCALINLVYGHAGCGTSYHRPLKTGAGGDQPDDNTSAATLTGDGDGGFPSEYPLDRGDGAGEQHVAPVAILESAFSARVSRKLAAMGFRPISVSPDTDFQTIRQTTSVLLVPTGGLMGRRESTQLRAGLDEFVSGGGTVVAFAQQRGGDFGVLPTGAAPIGAWGWREDNSCYSNGSYVDRFHPALASQTSALVTAHVDGYFDSIPEDATVLLRRVKNSRPAMFTYPHGRGWVVVASTYDDSGGLNQTGRAGKSIVADTLTWASRPTDLPIHRAGDTVSVTLDLVNETHAEAAQVAVYLMTPLRDVVVREEAVLLEIPPGGTTTLSLAHTFAPESVLGIYHLDYELLDVEGGLIQRRREALSGRVVIGNPPAPGQYRPADMSAWVTMPDGEDVLEGTPVTFQYHITNRSTEPRRFRAYWEFNHRPGTLADDLVVPGGTTVTKDVTLTPPYWANRFWIHVFEEGGTPRWKTPLCVTTDPTAAYLTTDGKGFRRHSVSAGVTMTTDRPVYGVGEEVTATVKVTNTVPFPWTAEVVFKLDGIGQQHKTVQMPASTSAAATSVDVPFTFTVSQSRPWMSVQTAVMWGSRLVVSQRHVIRVEGTRLLSGALVQPNFWSRTSPNPIQWTIKNVGNVAAQNVAVSASLTGVPWTPTATVALAPGASQTVSFEAPPVPAHWSGQLLLVAAPGDGASVSASAKVEGWLGRDIATTTETLSAGESGEVLLTLMNYGNIRATGQASATIDGIGALEPLAYDLKPGDTTTLTFPFEVPASVVGEVHLGTVQLPDYGASSFLIRVRPPELEILIDERAYDLGESIVATLRNVGGSTANARVRARLEGAENLEATQEMTLDAGTQETVSLPAIPSHWPAATYRLKIHAHASQGVDASLVRSIQVLGTSATLSVATNEDIYAPSADMTASAHVTNGSKPLSGALLHLEIRRPCAADEPVFASTYHIDTWDGAKWIERAVRHRTAMFETDLVDLASYLPDADGEWKVRMRHVGGESCPAELDYAALLSQGVLVAPTSAVKDWGGDVLQEVSAADNDSTWACESTMTLVFPESPNPSLVFRAYEGGGDSESGSLACSEATLWQRDVPLELGPAALADTLDSLETSYEPGQYTLWGRIQTRTGTVLAQHEKTFYVTAGSAIVSIRTDETLYRWGSDVPIHLRVENLSEAAEPSLSLRVHRVWHYWHQEQIHNVALPTLQPHEGTDYSFTYNVGDEVGDDGNLLGLIAEVVRDGSDVLHRAAWAVRLGEPDLRVSLRAPTTAVHVDTATPRPVALEREDLDEVIESGTLVEGGLPFDLAFAGRTYDGFELSLRGIVPLLPVDLEGTLSGASFTSLSDFSHEALQQQGISVDGWMVLAPYLLDPDPGPGAFAGYKLYAPGSQDRAGRVFSETTLVFLWDVPTPDGLNHNRFQLLIAESGLIRMDVESGFATGDGERTGVVIIGEETHSAAPAIPFGLLVDGSASRGPVQGRIVLMNNGDYPGTVELQYGREGQAWPTASVVVPPNEQTSVEFDDEIVGPVTYTVSGTGDWAGPLTQNVVPVVPTLTAQYTGNSVYPPGLTALPVRLLLDGRTRETAEVTYTLTTATGVQALTRTYDLEPDVELVDALPFALPEGTATLTVTANGVEMTMDPVALTMTPAERVSLAVNVGAVAGGSLPIAVDVNNTGLEGFEGEVELEGFGGSVSPIAVAAGESTHLDLQVDLAGAAPGTQQYVLRLISGAGVVVAEEGFSREVKAAQVVLTESPAGQAFDIGQLATLRFVLENPGDQTAFGVFRFEVFDEGLSDGFDIGPGQQKEILFELWIEEDVEAKTYPGRYTIETADGVPVSGQVNFQVNGIALEVEASLDKEAYADGDAAQFTVSIQNQRPTLGTDYLVRVHYGDYEETRPVTITESASVTFEVPLPSVTGEALFLGISHPLGRSLYINTYHVRRADDLVLVTLDGQVYEPGSTVTISAVASTSGTLILSGPGGYAETLEVTGAVSRTLALPAALPGGTYSVDWAFRPASGDAASGSIRFDVSGIRVRVFAADLDRSRYETGDAIESRLIINTNESRTVSLRGFSLDPDGESEYLGAVLVTLSPEADLVTTNSWPFTSTVAGIHQWVYGLYDQETEWLLASGAVAFEAGRGVVLGVHTDKQDYPFPTESVAVSVRAFVTAPVSVQLTVDDVVSETLDSSITGLLTLSATLSGVSPGPHRLDAVIDADGYVSRQTTRFEYATSLPDLLVEPPFARRVSGTLWEIEATVSNAAPTEAPASMLLFRNPATGAQLGSRDVPPLAPNDAAAILLDWNVAGAAGAHEIEVVADAAGSVSEYREDNNTATAVMEIPEVVVDAVVTASYPAQASAGLGGKVTNLSPSTVFEGLTVQAAVTSPGSVVTSLGPVALAPLAPGTSAPFATPWDVGTASPGTYTYSVEVTALSGTVLASDTRLFEVEPTTLVAGSVAANPNPVSPGAAVNFTGQVENRGNVAVSGTAVFSLVATDDTIVLERRVPLEVAIGASVTAETAVPNLDVVVGEYRLSLTIEIADDTYPVASAAVSVVGQSVEAGLAADVSQRVLVYVGGNLFDTAGRARRMQFVAEALGGTGSIVKTTTDPIEFGKLYRSGQWTTHVVLTEAPVLLPLLADELREGVYRGNGFVFVQWGPGASMSLEPAIGGKVVGRLPGKPHTAAFVASDLGPAQNLAVPASVVRLSATDGTVVATWENGVPAVLVNQLGEGRSVTLAFDPSTIAGTSGHELLAAAVGYVAPQASVPTDAGRVVSLAVALHNPTSVAQTVDVALELPPGIVVADVDDAPVQVAPPLWQVTVGAGATVPLRFQVVLPDVDGTYEMRTTVRVGGVLLAEQPAITVVVPSSVSDALGEAIATLDVLQVPPGDRGHVRSALALLRVAQRADDHLLGLEIKIRALAEAGEKLGRVDGVDVAAVRAAAGSVLAAAERQCFARVEGLEATRRQATPRIAAAAWWPPFGQGAGISMGP